MNHINDNTVPPEFPKVRYVWGTPADLEGTSLPTCSRKDYEECKEAGECQGGDIPAKEAFKSCRRYRIVVTRDSS